MFIRKDQIEQVRDRSDIVEIVKRYVPSLKKRGANYIGLCPFHREKTPSFTVSPDKQIYHCFGCGSGGNVFSFIRNIERLEFTESVKFLADAVGIEIKEDKPSVNDNLLELKNRYNAYTANFYRKYLLSAEGQKGRDYLKERGVSEEASEKFCLGYAPGSWDALALSLKKFNKDSEVAVKLGLLGLSQKSTEKRFYDRFRDRIIFPIHDHRNRLVAFGGRAIGGEGPKYLNSPESDIFMKRKILYGLNIAAEEIRELDRAIIVEGYLDVIGAHQAGISNVVAPLGTALTAEQLQLLSRYCSNIIVLFDSDEAGVNASLRSIETAESVNISLKIALLPESDPFEYLQIKGPRALMAVIDSAVPAVDFKISQIMKKSDGSDISRVLPEIFSVIEKMDFESEKNRYFARLSKITGLDENSLRIDFANYRKKNFSSSKALKIREKSPEYLVRCSRELLLILFSHPELMSRAVYDFSPDDIHGETEKSIFVRMRELFTEDHSFSVNKLFDFFGGKPEMEILNQSVKDIHFFEDPGTAYTEIFLNMKLFAIDGKIRNCEDLTEIEILRREKEKISSYIYGGSAKSVTK